MIKFITVTDAITKKEMLINTSLIAKVEESIYSTSNGEFSVRHILFVEDYGDEYITDTMKYLMNYLCNS